MKKLLALVAAAVLALAVAGCGSASSQTAQTTEAGGYLFEVENVDAGTVMDTFDGLIVIDEGQMLVITPDIQKGGMTVTLTNTYGEVAFEQEVSGSSIVTKRLPYAAYNIEVVCSGDGTTGSLLVEPGDNE